MQSAARRISSSSSVSSIPLSKRVFIERSDALLRSKRCFAASVTSESFKDEKRQNRISKQERREMLDDFVKRYRDLNAGRFPTASHAQKQVGGSYYVVREIIQELEYNHKMSPQKPGEPAEFGAKIDLSADTGECPVMKDDVVVGPLEVKVPLISTDSKKAFVEESVTVCAEEKPSELGAKIDVSADTGASQVIKAGVMVGPFEVKAPLVSTDSEKALVEECVTVCSKEKPAELGAKIDVGAGTGESPVMKDGVVIGSFKVKAPLISTDSEKVFVEESATVCAEKRPAKFGAKTDVIVDTGESPVMKDGVAGGSVEEKVPLICMGSEKGFVEESATVCAEEEVEQRSNQEVSKSDKLAGDTSITLEEDATSQKGSSIWGNLRSLADGIINFWRKK